jgi:2-dehydropantoate 2-reductase
VARVAIVGCGAMGSVYAGLMADAGHEVFAVTLWPDHAQAMRDNGLRVEGASGDRLVRVRASTGTDGIGPCDLVVIATKAFDVEAAARSTLPLLGPETVVQTIQNGLGSAERVAPVVGPERLAVGVAGGFGASMRGPGHVHHNGMEMVRFGAYGGLPTQLLQASAEIWRSAGFNVKLFQDIDRMVWEKLIMNVTFSGTSALTGLTVGEIMADPHAGRSRAVVPRRRSRSRPQSASRFRSAIRSSTSAISAAASRPPARPCSSITWLAGARRST